MSTGSILNAATVAETAKGILGLGLIGAGIGTLASAYAAKGNLYKNATGQALNYAENQGYIYPSDLVNGNRNFTLTFAFYQYQRPTVASAPFTSPLGSITLPLPPNLIDRQEIRYQDENAQGPLGAIIDGGLQAIRDGTESGGQAALNIGGATAVAGAEGALNGLQVATGVNIPPKQVMNLYGLAQNPYLTVMFQGPNFKTHQFTWTFSPDNYKDSVLLRFINNKFKYHSLPGISTGWGAGSLYQYPDVCLPLITPTGFVYDFKHCVILNSELDYAPGATPGFHNSNAPSALKLTLTLQEIEIWTKNDIINASSAFGGQSNNLLSTLP